jgi:hypothetical protein
MAASCLNHAKPVMQKQQFELTLQRLKCFQQCFEFGAARRREDLLLSSSTNGIGAKRHLAAIFPES